MCDEYSIITSLFFVHRYNRTGYTLNIQKRKKNDNNREWGARAMGSGYTRIIGVKKFWLITGLLGLEIVNLQVLGNFIGSGLSAALSVLWIFVVVVIIATNIEDITNLIHGHYTLDKQNITERLEDITRRQEELEGKYQETLAGWEKKIADKLTLMINDMPQMVEHVEAEIVKNSEETKQSLLKSLMDLEHAMKANDLAAKEQRDKILGTISDLFSKLADVSKQITESADNDKRQVEEIGRQCNAILEAIGREVAGLTQQVDAKTGAITQLLEIKSTEVEGRLTAGSDKHAEMLKVSVEAIRQQVMRSDESLVHTINKMQLETEERVKVYKRMVETAFAELTAEFVELKGDTRLHHKEIMAQISENEDSLKRMEADVELAVSKSVEVLVGQIGKNNEAYQNNLERMALDIKESFVNTNAVIQTGQKIIEEQKETIQNDIAELKDYSTERLNNVQVKITESFTALQKNEAVRAESQLAKLDILGQDMIHRFNVLTENAEDQYKKLETDKESVQQSISELQNDALSKLNEVHEKLLGNYIALQKEAEVREGKHSGEIENLRQDIIQRLSTIEANADVQGKRLEDGKETIKQGIEELKKETLDKLSNIHMNLVDSYAALQKDEDAKTKSRLAKFDIAIKDIIQCLNGLKSDNETQGKLLKANLEQQKDRAEQGWDGLLKAISGDLQQLRHEFTQATQPLSEQLSRVAENVADVKISSSKQKEVQDSQQDDYKQIMAGQEKLQNDLRTMEANILSWQEPWDLLDGMEKRLASLKSIVDTIASQQKELLTESVKPQSVMEEVDKKASKSEKKKSKKIQYVDAVSPLLTEQPVADDNVLESVEHKDTANEPVPALEPNRTEIIEDKENNSTILREFRDNEIYKDMMMSGDVLRHEVYYDAKGNPKRAINYDEKEEVKYELEYYPNGEAKKRIEYVTRNGKQEVIVTNFDEQGHKLS